MIFIRSHPQIIADCIKANHKKAQKEGKALDLRTFIAGRNRLENPGAKALAEAFSVSHTLNKVFASRIERQSPCGV